MDITWVPEPLSSEAKRRGVKPFDYRAKAGTLTLRARGYYASTRWRATVYNETLGPVIGGTYEFPLELEVGLPDLASAQAKAEEFARYLTAPPGTLSSRERKTDDEVGALTNRFWGAVAGASRSEFGKLAAEWSQKYDMSPRAKVALGYINGTHDSPDGGEWPPMSMAPAESHRRTIVRDA